MSNPTVCFLASMEINGVNFRIEDNLGEAIHIHIGRLRIALSIDDFFIVAEGVIEAVWQLFQVRHIDLESLDVESLKGEWLKNYEKISMVHVEYVTLDSLYMKESYIKHRAIKRIIPLRESGYIKLLKGDKDDIQYYKEAGKMEPSRKEKLDFIKQKVDLEGYPWNQKLILVDQDGYIYDGIKRASYLYYQQNGCGVIPVLRIYLQREITLAEEMKKAERAVEVWNREKCVERTEFRRGVEKDFFRPLQTTETEKIGLCDFIQELNKIEIPFLVVKRARKNKQGEVIAIASVIVAEGTLAIVQEKLDVMWQNTSPYDEYEFLYTAPKPLYYFTTQGPILVFDRLCCQNKFEKYILPVDRYILEKIWELKVWNEDWYCYFIGIESYILIILMEALFEFGHFEKDDIVFIEMHNNVLCKAGFKNMLEKEFYQYTPMLIHYILSQQYDKAISSYEHFSDY